MVHQVSNHRPKGDWTRGFIRCQLQDKANTTFSELDRLNRLADDSCSKAASVAHEAGENAIADALGLKPKDIWPSRFSAKGVRLRPQPPRNYKRKRKQRHRQKVRAA